MRWLVVLCLLILCPSIALSQAISQQEWQTATISSGSITINCADSLLPYDKGDFLDEPSLFTVRGEMDESMRSSHPVKVCLQPESGSSDILDTISGCTDDGARLELRVCDAGEVITIGDTTVGNSGAIQLLDDNDIYLNDERMVVVLELFNGAWSAIGSGAAGASGADIIFGQAQKLDMSAVDLSNADVGFIVPMRTTCAAAITLGQWCYDSDDNQICIGTGTSTMCIGGVACSDSQTCFQNAITGIGTVEATFLDSNNDGFVMDISGGGPRFRCMTDYGGAGEAECTPSETKSFAFLSGVADESECFRQFDVVVNDETVPIGYYCVDNDTGGTGVVRFHMPVPKRWDGTTLKITAHLHSNEATPEGDLNYDWTGYCSEHSSGIGTSNYPTATANSEMVIDLDSISTDEEAVGTTVGNIALSNCTSANAKYLHLQMKMDETSSTVDNWSSQILIGFIGEYGSKQYSD